MTLPSGKVISPGAKSAGNASLGFGFEPLM